MRTADLLGKVYNLVENSLEKVYSCYENSLGKVYGVYECVFLTEMFAIAEKQPAVPYRCRFTQLLV
jgi:hypothetical protein